MKNGFYLLIALALLVLSIGCSEQPLENESLDLATEFGGYTAGPEAPAFGDADLMDMSGDEVSVNDPILASPAGNLLDEPDAGIFHLRAIWGQLEFDSTVTTPTDWSGSLTVSRGAEFVRRLIRFEDGQDYLVERTDPKLIEWVSITTVHNDGIAVDIVVPPALPVYDTTVITDSLGNESIVVDTIMPEPATVTFQTGLYSQTFSLEELAMLDTLVTLKDSNQVLLQAQQVYRLPGCRRGFMRGQWGVNDSGQTMYRGIITNRSGDEIGHVRGYVTRDREGRRALYGKWISVNGEFEGFLLGRWQQNPSSEADPTAVRHAGGRFGGLLFDANRNPIGAFHGIYQKANNLERGFFQARWRAFCGSPDEPSIGGEQFRPEGQ